MLGCLILVVACVAIAVHGQETCGEDYIENVGFVKLGSYKGTTGCGHTYAKTYYIPQNNRVTWIHARSVCQSYGMEFLSLETLEEANFFLTLSDKNIAHFDDLTHVGAITTVGKSLDKWYWVNSGKRVDFSLKFSPGEPNFGGNAEYCLAVGRVPGNFMFQDLLCYGAYEKKFVCQKIDF